MRSTKKNRKAAGIREIAEALGTSIGTVDRALHGRTGVSARTKTRVLRMTEQLGYQSIALLKAKTRPDAIYISTANSLPVFHALDELKLLVVLLTRAGTAGFNYSTRASGGAYVGSFGAGAANTITFNNVTAPATGTYQLEIDYVTDGPCTAYVSVNGATPVQLTFNGNNWYDPVPYVMPVQLIGGTNTIVFSNPNPAGYAPGIDVIIVSSGATARVR